MRGQVKMERKTKQSTVITLLEVFIKAMLFESWFHNSICEKKRSPTNMRHSLTKMADIQVTHMQVFVRRLIGFLHVM